LGPNIFLGILFPTPSIYVSRWVRPSFIPIQEDPLSPWHGASSGCGWWRSPDMEGSCEYTV
jgi:hypothetical protein